MSATGAQAHLQQLVGQFYDYVNIFLAPPSNSEKSEFA